MFLPRVANFPSGCTRAPVDIHQFLSLSRLPLLASTRQVHNFPWQRIRASSKHERLMTKVASVNDVRVAQTLASPLPRRSIRRSFGSFSASSGSAESNLQWISRNTARVQPCHRRHSSYHRAQDCSSKPVASSAAVSECSEFLNISWENGEKTRYPWVWLRDNCQCPACFQPTAKARLSLLENLDVDCKPCQVVLDDSNQTVQIAWSDGHKSVLSTKWLNDRSFAPKQQQIRSGWYKNPRIQWPTDFDASQIRRFGFDDVTSSDPSLLEFLETLEAHGLVLIEDAPREEGMIRKVADRIAFLRTTNYGQEFTVKAKLDPSNAAYTGAKLGLHTDLVYYNYMPGVQFLHCIEQAKGEGGENQFADGMAAAANIRGASLDDYVILTTVPVDFYDVGRDYYEFHKIQRRPVIESSLEGEVYRINYNNQVRDSFLNIPVERVKPMYKALKLLEEELRKNAVSIKLREGDIVVFDNMRVLHGRNAFNFDGNTSRHLQGGYTDWDEVRSRIRILRSNLTKSE